MYNNLLVYVKRASNLNFNKKEFVDWCEDNSSGKIKDNSAKTYANDILVFLEQYNKPISTLVAKDVSDYFTLKNRSERTQKKFIHAIGSFVKFINHEFNYKVNIDSIKIINSKPTNDYNNNNSKPLTIDEIVKFRNKFILEDKPRWIFIFNMVLYYGLSLDQLEQCTTANYSFKDKSFFIDNEKLHIIDSLAELIMENPSILHNVKASNFQYHISCMGGMLNRKIKWSDLIETRKLNLLTCPCCNKEFINDADFWVLAEHKDDVLHKNWFICNECANIYGE
jgi:hypothetical protein